MISKLILMYIVAFIFDMIIFSLFSMFFREENITFENNLKISAVLSLISVITVILNGV